MGCSCIYVGDDWSGRTMVKQTDNRARIKHECYECGRTINVGEKYRYEAMVGDGDLEVYKICHDCLSLRDAFFCYGWYYGEIWHEFTESVRSGEIHVGPDCLDELTEAARKAAVKIIDDEIGGDDGD